MEYFGKRLFGYKTNNLSISFCSNTAKVPFVSFFSEDDKFNEEKRDSPKGELDIPSPVNEDLPHDRRRTSIIQ